MSFVECGGLAVAFAVEPQAVTSKARIRKESSLVYVAQPIEWTDRGVIMLDQRRLPGEEISHTYTDYREVARAIREMVIRGAPAIGVAAAMGAALGVLHSPATS